MTTAIVVAVCVGLPLLFWLVAERGLLQPSTRSLIKVNGGLNERTLHAIVYYRWYERYVRLALRFTKYSIVRKWAVDNYHSKIVTPEQAQAIVSFDREIPLRDLEQIVPYPNARKLMLSASPEVALTECPCRNVRESHCQPSQVCMVIGQPFVDFVMEHRPQASRRVTQEEALQLLKDEHERGHVHSAWFKDAFGGRMFAICNCCKCCCGAIEIMSNYNAELFAPSGYAAAIDVDRCISCGACESACPFDAIAANDVVTIDFAQCRGCGVCVTQCVSDAIMLVQDERKGIPFDVRALPKGEEVEQWIPPDAPGNSVTVPPRVSGFRAKSKKSDEGRSKKLG